MDTRELFIVRHAKSDWSNDPAADYDRPLSPRGEQDVPRVAQWLVSSNIKPDLLISSPARRAIQTAETIATRVGIPEQAFVRDPRLYLANEEILLSVISQISDRYLSVMLVGHNPGLENILLRLSGDPLPFNDSGTLLTTANVVQLQFRTSWQKLQNKQGRLVNFIRPETLP